MRTRAALLSHGPQTHSPYHLPELGKQNADKAHRDGVAARLAEAAGHQTREVDLALITYADERLKNLALSLLKTAQHHDAHPLDLLQPVPGTGQSLSLVWLSDIHRIDRLPSGPEFASYARLVTCSQDSGGKRLGTSGQTLGTAPLQWAFSEAAPRCLRHTPHGQTLWARLAQKPDKGKALSLLTHKRGRAVYVILTRQVAVAMEIFL
jgi:transposase